jgi:hypothetical protein
MMREELLHHGEKGLPSCQWVLPQATSQGEWQKK